MSDSSIIQTDTPRVHNIYHKTAPPGAVLIGRTTKWGNPFIVGVHGERGECVELYREWAWSIPELIAEARKELRGKHLVCYCKPRACHGDVLLEIANS